VEGNLRQVLEAGSRQASCSGRTLSHS